MKKQLMTIGIIGILIAISISGCLENKESNENNIIPLSEKVTVTTNKTEFEQNETINITIYNGLNVSIFYDYPFIPFIERKTTNGWDSFYAYCINCMFEYALPTELKPGESTSFEWQPEIWWWVDEINASYSAPSPGLYRLKCYYRLKDNWTGQSVYSNEFTITGENRSDYKPTNIKDVVITLKRGPCGGICSIYNLTIYGNGTVVYDGWYNVNITGTKTINIGEEKVIQLISEFEKIDYFSLKDSYTNIGPSDLSSAITSLTINGRTKTISHYYGDTTAPIGLRELEDKIDEIVNSSQWID